MTRYNKPILLIVLLISFVLTKAQIRYAPLSTENFTISVKNMAKTAPNKLEFDVYLLDGDASQRFELGSCQLGFLFNSLIYKGGTVTVDVNNTGSGLNPAQQFTSRPEVITSVPGYSNKTLIKLAGQEAPGTGNGMIISTSAPGTLLTHFTITSTVNFTGNFTPDLTFVSNDITLPLYATRVSEYINHINTPLTINPEVNAIVSDNPVLTDNFLLSVQNMKKTGPNQLEFDIFLLDTDPGQPFELGNCQVGFLLNSAVYAGGTLTASVNNTGSGLNDGQKFTATPSIVSSLPGHPGQTLIRLAGRPCPGTGGGTIISQTGYGTLLTHLVLTSSVNFKINSSPGLTFTSNTVLNPLYATRVSEYINNVNTPLTVMPGVNAIVNGNPVLTDDFILSVQNLVQTAPAKLEFDVNLYDPDSHMPFELGSCQLAFLLNSGIYSGGTLSVAVTNSGSGLKDAQQFTALPVVVSSVPGHQNQTLIKLAGRLVPGEGKGTIISTSDPQTTLTHFVITSSVNFIANSTPDLSFVSSRAVIPLYPTRISEYIDHLNTALIVMPDTNAIVNGNPVLNPTLTAPNIYTVTGNGSYCHGSDGFPVGLDNSDPGVTYTLYKDGIAQVPTLAGTGSAISFGNQLLGTYTVSGTNESGTVFMIGSAVISENPSNTPGITITSSINDICSDTPVTFTATGVNKGMNPVYQWQVNGVNAGSNNEVFIYIPGNNDIITCQMTSNADCAGDPVMSNAITMNIAPPVAGGVLTGNSSITYGNSTGMMILSGYEGNVVKWQKKKDSEGWTDIVSNSVSYSEIPSSAGTWAYRALVSSGSCGDKAYSNTLSITVSPKTLTIGGSFLAGSKQYDGTTAAVITGNYLTLNTKADNDDAVDLVAVAAFADKEIGISKTVNLLGSSLSGAEAGNYILSFSGAPTTTADITAVPVTLGPFPDINKTYGDPDFVLVNPSSPSPGAFRYESSNLKVATISGNTVTIVGAGTATITVTQEAFGEYGSGTATTVLTVSKANQIITLEPFPSPLPLNQFIGKPQMLTATSSSGLPVTLTLGAGSPATLVFLDGHYYLTTTLNLGIVVIIAKQAGNENYNPAQLIQSFDVTKGNQTITFNALNPVTYAPGRAIDLEATSNSGLPVSFAVVSGKAVIINGNHLEISGAGTVVIEASQAGNEEWNPANKVYRNLVVNKAIPSIINFDDIVKTYGDPSFTLDATSNSTGAIRYSSADSNVATISGNRVTITGAGMTKITVTQDASDDYMGASVQKTLFVYKANQTITFNPLEDKNVGDPDFDLTATSTSGLDITFTSSNTSVATINGKTVTLLNPGTTIITASQPGNSNYNAAQQISRIMVVNHCMDPLNGGSITGDQSSCGQFDPLPITSRTAPNGQFGTLEYKWQQSILSSSEGFEDIENSNSISYDPGMLIETTWFRRIARAACTGDWSGAVESNVVEIKVDPGTVGGKITGQKHIVYGNSTGEMILSENIGIVLKWQKCKVVTGVSDIWTDIATTGLTYSEFPSSAGTWKYRAQVKSGNCSSLFSIPLTIEVTPRTLTITGTFTADNKIYDGTADAMILSDRLRLNTKVGNDEVYLSPIAEFNDKNIGTSKMVSLTGTSLMGSDAENYLLSLTGAPTATADITPVPVTLSKFPDIYKTYGDPDFVLINPTSNSYGKFNFSSSNSKVATISGNTVTIHNAGTAIITATQQAFDGFASASITALLTVEKADQVLTLDPLPSPLPLNQFIGTPIMLEASSSSGLDVTISVSQDSPAVIKFIEGQYFLTATSSVGIVEVIVKQAGNENYNPATLIQRFDVTKGNQIITFDPLPPVDYEPSLSMDLSSFASSGLPVKFEVIAGPAYITNGNHLNVTGAGTVVVQASQSGNQSWNPATSVSRSLVINKAVPVIVNFADIIKTYGDPSFLLNANSMSSGAFTYSSSNAKVATILGNSVIIEGAGITTVTVTQDASSDYISATAQITLFVKKAQQTITFKPVEDKNMGDPPFELTASSTSGLGIVFTGSNPSVATINGKTVTIVGDGVTTITASQPGNSNYLPAPSVYQTFRVNSYENPISSVQNLVQTALNKLEFDVYLLNINSSRLFELATSQLGFYINSLICPGGELSVAIDNTRSGLDAAQQFTAVPTLVSSLPGHPDQILIKLAGRIAPGCGNGTFISAATPGTLLTHIIVTGTVPFKANSTPNLRYTSNSVINPIYPTRLSEYVDNRDVPLTVIPGINAVVNGNPFLNPTSELPPPKIVSITQPTCSVPTGSVLLGNLPAGVWKILIYPYGGIKTGIGTSTILDGLPVGTTPANYKVTVADSYGCTSPMSDLITINPLQSVPISPVITREGNTLTSNCETGNQWYLDGVAVPGATGKQFTVVSPGTYYSVVTTEGCSSGTSNWIPFLKVDFNFSVYPSPSTGLFNLKIESAESEILDLKIYNVVGILIWEKSNVSVHGLAKIEVDLSKYTNGTYLVCLMNQKHNLVKKLIIMH